MLANITINGELTITPENETESYALNCWFDSYSRDGGSATLSIETFEEEEEID